MNFHFISGALAQTPHSRVCALVEADILSVTAHAAHAAHATHTAWVWHSRLFFSRDFRQEARGREEQSRDARGVLQRNADDLRRIDDARLDKIAVGIFVGVVTVVLTFHFTNMINDNRTFDARVFGNFADRRGKGALNDLDAVNLVADSAFDFRQRVRSAQESYAAARYDAFFGAAFVAA